MRIPLRAYPAEFAGTFLLVFVGAGSVVVDQLSGGAIGRLGISLAFGLAVALAILLFGDVSGAHINPAVTAAFWIRGKVSAGKAGLFMLCQFAGATAAALALKVIFPGSSTLGETLPSVSAFNAFFIEALATFTLVSVVFWVVAVPGANKAKTALAAGLVIATAAFIAGPLTGASLNPARSLGPALVSGEFSSIWIYLTAPIVGALLAVLANQYRK